MQRPQSMAAVEDDAKDSKFIENSEATPGHQTYDGDGELLLPERRAVAEKQLVRKLDVRLLPAIVLIFILNYIDVSPSLSLPIHE